MSGLKRISLSRKSSSLISPLAIAMWRLNVVPGASWCFIVEANTRVEAKGMERE